MYFIFIHYHYPTGSAQTGLMDLKTLHLMFILISVSHAQQRIVVSQPSSAEGTEGGSITLHCSYNSTSKITVGSYRWVKDPSVTVRNTTQEFLGRVNLTSDQGFLLERRADIEIQDLRHYDSGMYRCVVNIPGLGVTTGNGTELCVVKEGLKGTKVVLQGDIMVLIWLLLRAVLCTFGITTTALVTRLYYEKTIPQNRPSHSRENEHKAGSRK
ncbi:natural cytotoxicity triggering receptor 3 [Rhineura floridana]|uniref:natural cytotoxicity triggering receptor 3 n=1 Tax=Rhineura floridana TaxID=261503 RepID=UPI002AC84A54|nr:natural cytotoxicity triggering receptor 3 [Rhineura floridana]